LDEEQIEARWLDELVGPAPETTPPPQQPGNLEDFSVSAEAEWGMDAFASPEQPAETPTEPDSLLWDNPKAKLNRLFILSHKSIIYANPAPSDIPHIRGLFTEKKMLRDLLGENAQLFEFSNRQVRDEALAALQLKLGSGFSKSSYSYPLLDKILAPLLIFVVMAALGWGLIAGLPLLEGNPIFQSGPLQVILSSLQLFVTNIGVITLSAIVGLFGLLCLIWLVSNLRKPSEQVIMERL
jgi:hypothetical protein